MVVFDQKKILNQIEWNNLIILDACRYDIFKHLWNRNEKVLKTLSPASWTLEWLDRIFGDKFIDANVFSATPYINSLCEINLYGIRWNAREHFSKIIDLWLSAWDPKIGTVPPGKIYFSVLIHEFRRRKIKTRKKRIIWFLQPHYPYLSEHLMDLLEKYSHELTYRDFLTGKLEQVVRKLITNIAIKNKDMIMKAYEETLSKTLKYIYRLIDKLDGTTIITSDHGELLGENFLLQLLSTITNLAIQSIRDKTRVYLQRRLYILSTLIRSGRCNIGNKNKLSFSKCNIGSAYIVKGRIFFHPSIMYSTELRKVPFVVIK